ncbi:MAG: DUF5606 family protein [Bacteroides sp.]
MLKTILTIAGKPGLYKLVSQGNNMLIVEAISPDKKRMPSHATDRIVSLGDIAIYTNDSEAALADIFETIQKKEGGKPTSINPKKASKQELTAYLEEVLPDYDQDRVYPNDIKKMLNWYNTLITNGITEFKEKEEETTEE